MVIDIAIILVMVAIVSSLAQLGALLLPKRLSVSPELPEAIGTFVTLMPFVYFFLTTTVIGRTAGKELMGLRVVRTDGSRLSVFRSLFRVFAYLVSLIPLGAGFLWILVDRDRRGWHDHMVGSRVVHRDSAPR
jgi:uncharacterized RDD family membrane protein YckC